MSNNNQNKPVIMIGGGNNGSNQQMSSLIGAGNSNLYGHGNVGTGANKNDRFKKQPKQSANSNASPSDYNGKLLRLIEWTVVIEVMRSRKNNQSSILLAANSIIDNQANNN